MTTPAVALRGVTKTYRMGVGRARVREMLPWPLDLVGARLLPRWWWKNSFDALHDLTLDVQAGESLGIVGHNGAGKTTLLKVLCGVTAPTRGRVTVPGKVAALIDVLVAFHPDLTGRENVAMLGAMFGMGRTQVAERTDEILEFAEIKDLVDTPLKRFSAGMAARLGFATVTALDASVLMIDEVLAVGDAGFQRKCIRWLDEYRGRGGTLLFVSHNLGLVRNMTDRVIWLDHGRLVADGPTASTLSSYAQAMERRDGDGTGGFRRLDTMKLLRTEGLRQWGSGGVRVQRAHVEDPPGDSRVSVWIDYEATEVADVRFCVGLADEAGREVGAAVSAATPLELGSGTIRCDIDPLPLRAGIYFPVVAIAGQDGQIKDRWRLDRALVVEDDDLQEVASDLGPVIVDADWAVEVADEERGADAAR